jgi:hypothetical protein
MCQPEIGRQMLARGCLCGCPCCFGPWFRRFFSAKEQRDYLEDYRSQLKNELAGVEQRIKELKGK